MGFEYRLTVSPALVDLEASCDDVCSSTTFRRIVTSFVDVDGVGIEMVDTLTDSKWPHVADLHVQQDGRVYVLCHDGRGRAFMRLFVERLRNAGQTVTIDDDV